MRDTKSRDIRLGRVMTGVREQFLWLWNRRRWAFAAYMVYALMRIQARTGFHLVIPACDMSLSVRYVGLSMTTLPHVILFGIFYLLTAIQFDRLDLNSLTLSFFATLAVGLLVEIEEGATQTGYCR